MSQAAIRRLVFLATFGIAGCSGGPEPSFPALNYSYLPPITLDVASVTVANSFAPDAGAVQLDAEDPDPPADVLAAELSRRLIAGGAPGSATVTIEDASIDEANGQLTGVMTVRVDVASSDGTRTGFTEASVSHSEAAPDGSDDDMRAALYDITKQLMDAMNVQLQYRLQHDLPQWIVALPNPGGFGAAATPAAAAPGAIQSAPLAAPSAVPSAGVAPAAPANPATPSVPSLIPPNFPPPAANVPAPPPSPSPAPVTGAPQPLVPY